MTPTLKGHYFDGAFRSPPLSGPQSVRSFLKRECPGDTREVLWTMAIDYTQLDDVVESALGGFHFWRRCPLQERVSFLKSFQQRVMAKKEAMARAIALDSGRPLWEATLEVKAVVDRVDMVLDHAIPRIEEQSFPNLMTGVQGRLSYRPLGPCLVIGPFNFPCHLPNTQMLNALLAGNSVIFKPSEKTALSGELLIRCFHEAGFPKGVVNLAQGDGETARRLLQKAAVKGIFFTGSKDAGLSVLKATCQDLSKLVALELGGKNTAILHKDADLDLALTELIRGAFLSAGQRCTSTSLVMAHRSVIEPFLERFHATAKRIKVGHPLDEDPPFMGPLVDEKALNSYLLFMGMAKREGFEEVMRGKHLTEKRPGHYVAPSIHFSPQLREGRFLQSEIFGPNCTFIPYDDLEEAIAMANGTEYGLAACVFSKDKAVFEKGLQGIDAGLINWNRSNCGSSPHLPFGGVKNSGNHRPMGLTSIDAMVFPTASLEADRSPPAPLQGLR